MKSKRLLLAIIGTILCFTACHKSGTDSPVVDKWQQTKLRLYGDSAGAIIYDTTYTQPFTISDYIQFYTNGTCNTATDHYYYPNTQHYPVLSQSIAVSIATWKYSAIGGSTYVLNQQINLINPGGFKVTDTVRILNAHSLWLHSVFYSHIPGYTQVSDSYYEK